MKTLFLLGAATVAFAVAAPAFAQDTRTTTVEHADGSTTTTTRSVSKSGGGTVPGAAGGVVAGALVAGPIGAVVGGIAGATVGHSVAPPSEVRTYVTTQNMAPVAYQGTVEVGKPIDGTVEWREVPRYQKYSWAYLNGQRVVIDNSTHDVVAIY